MIFIYNLDKVEEGNFKDFKKMSSYLNDFLKNNPIYKNENSFEITPNDLEVSKKYLSFEQEVNNKIGKPIQYKPFNYQFKEIVKEQISKEYNTLKTKEDSLKLNKGTRYHEIFEAIDFSNPDISNFGLSGEEYSDISKILDLDIIKNLKNAKTYHEHEFRFIKDGKLYPGVIDLLCEFPDHIEIIDYKLYNVEKKEYERQLNLYKDYVKTKTNKDIKMYLLSLKTGIIKEVM
jgi:ATP-dependent exoDNAse (exonuclease V) beta subunit